MGSFCCYLFIYLGLISIARAEYQPTFIKSVNLTTVNRFENGASITDLNASNMDPNINEWDIDVADEIGFFLEISLDSSWGFHPNQKSMIQLTIHGRNDNPNDAELLVAFSVNSNKYLGVCINPLNTASNRITPLCDKSLDPSSTPLSTGDIKADVAFDNGMKRFDKLSENWVKYDKNQKFHGYPNQWPFIFTLTNDPMNNNAFMKLENPSWIESGWSQECGFESFPTNQGLQILISPDDPGEQFTLTQFDITYSYDLTADPTTNPTKMPTAIPTFDPSQNPTMDPTSNPTIYPTQAPTDTPSLLPSRNPSVQPTSMPTDDPTHGQSDYPTNTENEQQVQTEFSTDTTALYQIAVEDTNQKNSFDLYFPFIVAASLLLFCCIVSLIIKLTIKGKPEHEVEKKAVPVMESMYSVSTPS